MKSKKIILDTNLWISFLISHRLHEIDDLLLNNRIQLIFSKELIEEFVTVAKRPKLEKFFTEKNITDLLQLFDSFGKLVEVSTKVSVCRDYKDNFLLSLALDSQSDYLLTGDYDLLELKIIKQTKIISWTEFLSENV
ncbi:MAG: putative toxin-antitoxin system toxin component, PIN family [Schleiferiaceae bacterium]|nr:putative toxin-antitoxin system toxin component, PIN family [Schleiferiaceae bacterium]